MANDIYGFGTGATGGTNAGFDFSSSTIKTTDMMGYMTGLGAITDAFMSYEAGQMKKLAYEHDAAMQEINAKQIGIDAQFVIADKENELAQTLALQNVMAAASGRSGGGSLSNITQTSVANLKRDEKRILQTAESKKVSQMMGASASRTAGKTAASTGLLGSISDLTTGFTKASKYIS